MPHARSARQRTPNAASNAAVQIRASKLRLFGVGLVCAYVALVPLVFDPAADWPFTVPKALLSHVLAYMLAAVMAGLLARFGRDFVVWSWVHVPALAFLAASTLATAFAADDVLALFGTHARMLGLGTIAAWTTLYLAIALLVRTRRETVAVIASALAACGLVLVYELVQALGRDPFVWNVSTVARPFSSLGQATVMGQYASSLALGALALGLLADRIPRPVRVIALLLTGLLLVGAAATGTRSTLIGIGAGASVLLVLVFISHPSRSARMISLAGAAVASVALAVLLVASPLGARLAATFDPPPGAEPDDLLARFEPSFEVRLSLYRIALDMVRERPILGYGPDNFAIGVTQYRSEAEPFEIQNSLATSAHSWVGYVATGSGLVGLASFVGMTALAFVLAVRSDFNPVAITGAVTLAAFLGTGLTTVTDIGSDWIPWATIGMIAGASARPTATTADPSLKGRSTRSRKGSSNVASQFRLAAVAVSLGIGVLLSLTSLNAYGASRATESARQAREQGRVGDAVNFALAATRSDSARAEYWQGLGLAYASGTRWREASAAFDRAVALAPYDVRFLSDLVQTLLVLARDGDAGARARAIELAERAVVTDRNKPQAHQVRAQVMQATGSNAEAVRSIERALALVRDSGGLSLYLLAAQVYLDSGRPTDAVVVARKGVAGVGLTSGSVNLRFELARALLAAGKPLDALAELDVLLGIAPNHAAAQRLRAEIRADPQR